MAASVTMVPSLHVLAVVHSAGVEQALGTVRAALPGAVFSRRTEPLAELSLPDDLLQVPDVLLLEVDTDDERNFEALERIVRRRFPGVPVLVTAPTAALPVIRRMMRAGVADFLPQPLSPDDLREAMTQSISRRALTTPQPYGQVLIFLKAGGGVGATTLSTQAAITLARRRKGAPGAVCLLDLDVQFGAAALYLDLEDRIGLADLLDDPERLDGELLRSVMTPHSSGLHLLAPPPELVGVDTVTPEVVEALITFARGNYENVLVELPSAWTPWSYRAVQCCDTAILVVQLNVTGIRQARRQLDAMAANGLGEVPVRIVLNRLEPRWRRSVSIRDAERALGRSIDFTVANDYRSVSAAIAQGVAVRDIKARSKVVRDVRRIVESVTSVRAESGSGSGAVWTMPNVAVAHRD